MAKTSEDRECYATETTFVDALDRIVNFECPKGIVNHLNVTLSNVDGGWLLRIEAHRPCYGGDHENCELIAAMEKTLSVDNEETAQRIYTKLKEALESATAPN